MAIRRVTKDDKWLSMRFLQKRIQVHSIGNSVIFEERGLAAEASKTEIELEKEICK